MLPLLAGADPTTVGWAAVIGPYGALAVLVAVVLDQRATIREQGKELREDRKQIVEEVVPLATRMLDALKEAAEIVKASAKRGQQ